MSETEKTESTEPSGIAEEKTDQAQEKTVQAQEKTDATETAEVKILCTDNDGEIIPDRTYSRNFGDVTFSNDDPVCIVDVYGNGVKLRFKCELCEVLASSARSLKDHLEGSIHIRNVKQSGGLSLAAKVAVKRAAGEEPDLAAKIPKIEPPPPGEATESVLQDLLNTHKEPLIGLQYIDEYQNTASNNDPDYWCKMCDKTFNMKSVVSHVTGVTHRMKYLEENYPGYLAEINDKGAGHFMCKQYAEQIDKDEGRHKVNVLVHTGSTPITARDMMLSKARAGLTKKTAKQAEKKNRPPCLLDGVTFEDPSNPAPPKPTVAENTPQPAPTAPTASTPQNVTPTQNPAPPQSTTAPQWGQHTPWNNGTVAPPGMAPPGMEQRPPPPNPYPHGMPPRFNHPPPMRPMMPPRMNVPPPVVAPPVGLPTGPPPTAALDPLQMWNAYDWSVYGYDSTMYNAWYSGYYQPTYWPGQATSTTSNYSTTVTNYNSAAYIEKGPVTNTTSTDISVLEPTNKLQAALGIRPLSTTGIEVKTIKPNQELAASKKVAPVKPASVEPEKFSTIKTMKDIMKNADKLISSEEEASVALQASNVLTQALLNYRLKSVPKEILKSNNMIKLLQAKRKVEEA